MRSIEFLKEANPYQGADAAKFAAMSPEDQAWYTRGGGKPDINDPYIAMRAPNKGKPAATSSATGVGNPGEEAAAQAAADKADAVAGATDMSMGQAAAVNAADTAASATDMSMGQAAAVNAADTAASATDMSMGQAAAVNAAAPTQAAPTQAAPTQAASPAKPATNKSMSPAIAAYASRMGLLTNNKPNVDAIKKFQTANGLTADGIIGPNTAGAILSAQKPGGPAANLRGPASAQERSSYAKAPPANMTGQAATPTKPAAVQAAQPAVNPASAKIRAEIDRFKSKNNMSLQANQEYVARLQAKLDAAAAPAAGQAAQPAAPAAPLKPGLGSSPMRENTFEESVDMMRRMSTMLKG